MLKKVISGGQTGVDTYALAVANSFNIPTGGEMPLGFRTENGADPHKAKIYNLTEGRSMDYVERTKNNVHNSDGTLIFGNLDSAGTRVTINACRAFGKPHLVNPNVNEAVGFIINSNIETLNVAGNRESKLSQEESEKITETLFKILENFKK